MANRFFWWKKEDRETPLTVHAPREEIASVIIDYLTDGLLVFSKDSNLVLMNPEAEEMLSVKKEKVLIKHIFGLNSFPTFEPLVSSLGGEIKEISRREVEINKKNVEISSIVITKDREKLGTLVVLHDVTREKLVEVMKTEFITLATHQLRTPTSGIKWSLQMLLDGDFGELTEEQKKIIRKIYSSNERTILLMKDLLDVARIEEGSFLSGQVLSDIEEIIQTVVLKYTEEVKRKGIRFEFKKSEENIPEIMLDEDKIKIAVDNLVENAVRYTLKEGKVTVSVEKRESEIEVRVQDTGIGIPEKDQPKIFNKFFRAENALKTETEGTGLGLFMAKYIIEAHGGRIWFESHEGEGTIFYFTLPIKEEFGEYLNERFY